MSNSTVALPINLIPDEASPAWMNKGDNAWQLTAATLVGLQSIPGLMILYGGAVKKKWAVNSAFMGFYAFACVLVCWVGWGYHMSFGDALIKNIPFWGKPNVALNQKYLLGIAFSGKIPNATMVYFQFVFAAITLILIAGALLGRMNFYAWMLFVPLWLTFSYTIAAFSIWSPNGFLAKKGIIDYSGGYVIHLSSGAAGFTAAYWVGKPFFLILLFVLSFSGFFTNKSIVLRMSPTLMGEETLHRLTRSWATLHIANWFYGGTSTFFMVSEQVVQHVLYVTPRCVVHMLGSKIRHI